MEMRDHVGRSRQLNKPCGTWLRSTHPSWMLMWIFLNVFFFFLKKIPFFGS